MYCDWPDLGRCCFCLPLRRGVLALGYVSIIFSAFMVGVYSYSVHYDLGLEGEPIFTGRLMTEELCITLSCLKIVFDAILVYGAHMKRVSYLRAYYYFTLTTMVAVVMIQMVDLMKSDRINFGTLIELLIFYFTGICLKLYLLTLVRSLLRKMELSGPHMYDNQLQQIVSGETKIESNGIYNNPTVIPADV